MDLYLIEANRKIEDPLKANAANLIEVVGTPRLEPELFRVMRSAVGCEQLCAFSISHELGPRFLFASAQVPEKMLRIANERYVSRYWGMDPTNHIAVPETWLDKGVLIRCHPQEFKQLQYRRSCFNAMHWAEYGTHLIERVSLLRRRDAETIRINFYRHNRNGPFSVWELDKMATAANVLFSLVYRHAELRLPRCNSGSYRTMLNAVAPNLSGRETEVCSLIAAGLTSAEIAAKLGIGINTVMTYRKRAYVRLSISSQNELVRLIFGDRSVSPAN